MPGHGHDSIKIAFGICPSAAAIGFNSIRASDSWRRCRKRSYTMSIERLFDAVERRGNIGRRVAALVLPISNRPRVTSGCACKIGLREPGEHTSGPNLASRDNVAHKRNSIRFWKRHHLSSRFVESRPGHTLWPQGLIGAMSRRDDLNAIAGIGHRHGLYASHLLDLERAGCQRSEQRAEGDPPAERKSPGGRGRGRVVSKETVE